MKPFLLKYGIIEIRYHLVYAQNQDEAILKLIKFYNNQFIGEITVVTIL